MQTWLPIGNIVLQILKPEVAVLSVDLTSDYLYRLALDVTLSTT
jgi:hypothetical protein